MKLRPIKWYQKLLTSKGRRKERRFLVEGIRQVEQMLESSPESVEEILVLEGTTLAAGALPVRTLSDNQMKSVSDSETTPPAIAVSIIPDSFYAEQVSDELPEAVLFLEDVQDPGNVGTLIRSAAAFGYDMILMTDGCADPYAPKVVRSTAGALMSVCLVKKNGYERLSELKEKGYQVVTADIDGGVTSLSSVDKHIFALGNEGNGVSEKLIALTDEVYTIPFNQSCVESLNVAVAGSIGMAQWYNNKVG